MGLEFISGLLLVLALLATLVYVFKELFSNVRLDFSKVSLSDALGRQRNTEPAPINQHLVGMTGKVVRQRDDSERPMTIRVGSELWPARLTADEAGDAKAVVPGIGTEVVVTAVAGSVILVRAADSVDAST